MPSEGWHSWHSGAHLQLLSSPGRFTLSDDYGPGAAAGGWNSPPRSRDSHASVAGRPAAGGRGPERPRAALTERLRFHRERADASGRRTGLGATTDISHRGTCLVLIDLTNCCSFLPEAGRVKVRGRAVSLESNRKQPFVGNVLFGSDG